MQQYAMGVVFSLFSFRPIRVKLTLVAMGRFFIGRLLVSQLGGNLCREGRGRGSNV
jgi:hypothetical protein